MPRNWTAKLVEVCARYQVEQLLIVHKIGKRSRQVRWRCGIFDNQAESAKFISVKPSQSHPGQLGKHHDCFPRLLQEWRGVPTAKLSDHLGSIWVSPLDPDSAHICDGLINTGKAMCPDCSHIWLSLTELATQKRKAVSQLTLTQMPKLKKTRYTTYSDITFPAFIQKLASEVQPAPPNFERIRTISQGDRAWSDEELVKACHNLFNNRSVEKAALRGMNLIILKQRHCDDWPQFVKQHKLGNMNTTRHQMELYKLIAEQGHQKLLLLPPGRVTDLYYNIRKLRGHLQTTTFWKLAE